MFGKKNFNYKILAEEEMKKVETEAGKKSLLWTYFESHMKFIVWLIAIVIAGTFIGLVSSGLVKLKVYNDEKIEAPIIKNVEKNQGWLILGLGNSRHWIVKNGLDYSRAHRSPTNRTSWEVNTNHGKMFIHGDLVLIDEPLEDFLKHYKKTYKIPKGQEPIMIGEK